MSNDDYGIRISQGGISVDRAADYQMVLDDRWPMVEYLISEKITVTASSVAAGTVDYIPIFKHDLGFLPAFHFLFFSLTGYSTNGQNVTDFITADEKYIYMNVFKTSGQVITITLSFFLAVMTEDCNATFTAPIAAITADQSSGPSDYGIKILQRGTSRGIDETSKGGYSLNTNAKMFAYQSHGVQVPTGSPAQLSLLHGLGYPPTYFIARRLVVNATGHALNGKITVGPLGVTPVLAKNAGSILTLQRTQTALSGEYLYIILKDPVDLAR